MRLRKALAASAADTQRTSRLILLVSVAALAALLAAAAWRHHHSRPQAITYEVWGSAADVTWGPSGSTLDGTVPMKVTRPLGDAAFYAVNAQLSGTGEIHCTISVSGTVISRSEATSAYGIALCEISDDGGTWHSVT